MALVGSGDATGAHRKQDAAQGELQDRQVGVAVRQEVCEPCACSKSPIASQLQCSRVGVDSNLVALTSAVERLFGVLAA